MEKEIDIQLGYVANLKNASVVSKLQQWLNKNTLLYLDVKEVTLGPCALCLEWQEMGLPYNCLQKPEYCNRKQIYYQFITIYEETKLRFLGIQN